MGGRSYASLLCFARPQAAGISNSVRRAVKTEMRHHMVSPETKSHPLRPNHQHGEIHCGRCIDSLSAAAGISGLRVYKSRLLSEILIMAKTYSLQVSIAAREAEFRIAPTSKVSSVCKVSATHPRPQLHFCVIGLLCLRVCVSFSLFCVELQSRTRR